MKRILFYVALIVGTYALAFCTLWNAAEAAEVDIGTFNGDGVPTQWHLLGATTRATAFWSAKPALGAPGYIYVQFKTSPKGVSGHFSHIEIALVAMQCNPDGTPPDEYGMVGFSEFTMEGVQTRDLTSPLPLGERGYTADNPAIEKVFRRICADRGALVSR